MVYCDICGSVNLVLVMCRSDKFGDSFLEKAPDTGDMNQDTIFGKADYARAFL